MTPCRTLTPGNKLHEDPSPMRRRRCPILLSSAFLISDPDLFRVASTLDQLLDWGRPGRDFLMGPEAFIGKGIVLLLECRYAW